MCCPSHDAEQPWYRFGGGISLDLLPSSVVNCHKDWPNPETLSSFSPIISSWNGRWIQREYLERTNGQASTKLRLCAHVALVSGGNQANVGGPPLDSLRWFWGKQSGGARYGRDSEVAPYRQLPSCYFPCAVGIAACAMSMTSWIWNTVV